MQPPYIPPQDAAYDLWLANFSLILTGAPTSYGLTAPDAVIVAAAYDDWHAAFILATEPGTRTSPTIAEKDAQRAASTAIVRPYAQAISKDAGISDELKLGIGVNLPNFAPTPIPAPTTAPGLTLVQATPMQMKLAYRDSEAIAGKKKPFGVLALEVWRSVGTVAATDPAQCTYDKSVTKSPMFSSFTAGQQGKIVTYFARWITRSGPQGVQQSGPWSAPLSAFIN